MQQQPQRIPFDFQGTTYYKITQPINGIITGNIRRQDLLVYDSEIGGNWIGLIIIDRIHTCDEETFKWAFEWELREQFQITSRLRGYTYIYNLNTERLLYFIYNTLHTPLPPPLPSSQGYKDLKIIIKYFIRKKHGKAGHS